MKEFKSLEEFWPFYLQEHSSLWNRRLHFIGTTLSIFLFSYALYFKNYLFIPIAIVSGYAFAWVGHFFIEKNKPATFQYPVKSFLSDWIMYACFLTGKLDKELKAARVENKP